MLFSSLKNKQIIEKQTANDLGKIAKIHINERQIDYFLTNKDIIVSTKNVAKINDIIILNNDDRNYPKFNFFPLNNQAISNENGKNFGKLVDFQTNENFEITKILTDKKNMLSFKILSFSETNLIIEKTIKQKPKQIKMPDFFNTYTIISNYSFLIGRIVQKNIVVGQKIIIKQGVKIDKNILDIAMLYGKLVDLTLYSKQYNIQNLY